MAPAVLAVAMVARAGLIPRTSTGVDLGLIAGMSPAALAVVTGARLGQIPRMTLAAHLGRISGTTSAVDLGQIPRTISAAHLGRTSGTTAAAHRVPIPVTAAGCPVRIPAKARRRLALRIRPARIRPAPVGIPGPVSGRLVRRRLRLGRGVRRGVGRRLAVVGSRRALRAVTGS